MMCQLSVDAATLQRQAPKGTLIVSDWQGEQHGWSNYSYYHPEQRPKFTVLEKSSDGSIVQIQPLENCIVWTSYNGGLSHSSTRYQYYLCENELFGWTPIAQHEAIGAFLEFEYFKIEKVKLQWIGWHRTNENVWYLSDRHKIQGLNDEGAIIINMECVNPQPYLWTWRRIAEMPLVSNSDQSTDWIPLEVLDLKRVKLSPIRYKSNKYVDGMSLTEYRHTCTNYDEILKDKHVWPSAKQYLKSRIALRYNSL